MPTDDTPPGPTHRDIDCASWALLLLRMMGEGDHQGVTSTIEERLQWLAGRDERSRQMVSHFAPDLIQPHLWTQV